MPQQNNRLPTDNNKEDHKSSYCTYLGVRLRVPDKVENDARRLLGPTALASGRHERVLVLVTRHLCTRQQAGPSYSVAGGGGGKREQPLHVVEKRGTLAKINTRFKHYMSYSAPRWMVAPWCLSEMGGGWSRWQHSHVSFEQL